MGAAAGSAGLRGECVDLLDLLRVASVDVVEAITRWRGGGEGGAGGASGASGVGGATLVAATMEASRAPSQAPFVWNGINYLLKMPSDLDFLDEVVPLTSWLGFSMLRNPFIMPNSLDQLQSMTQSGAFSTVDADIDLLNATNFVDQRSIRRSHHLVCAARVALVSSLPPSVHAGTAHDPTMGAVDTDFVGIGGNPVQLPGAKRARKSARTRSRSRSCIRRQLSTTRPTATAAAAAAGRGGSYTPTHVARHWVSPRRRWHRR